MLTSRRTSARACRGGSGAQSLFMSAVTEYLRLRPHELVELRRLLAVDSHGAFEYACGLGRGEEDAQASSRGIDTDKAWAGLRYLLAKLDPPVDVISGGEPLTNDQWGYDSPRLFTADQ